MARIKNSVFKEVSGKVGSVVCSSWKGIGIMKGLPAPSRVKPSEKQLSQRQKFNVSGVFMKAMREVIELAYREYPLQMSPRNAVQAHILQHAFIGVYPHLELDYSKIILAAGRLPGAIDASAEGVAGRIRFRWSDNSNNGMARAGDRAILVVYCPARRSCVYDYIHHTRSSVSGIIELPLFVGCEVHTWLSFLSQNGKDVAGSVYTGKMML